MSSHRVERIAEAIREVVSSAILFQVADPRVQGVTVLKVELSGDLRNASIHVSIMGTEAEQRRAMHGLRSAGGFLQSRVAARLQTKTTPHLAFKIDDGVKKSIEISRLIDEALASDRQGKTGVDEIAGEIADDDHVAGDEIDEELTDPADSDKRDAPPP
jgi:ribosome-binding factor A